MAELYQVLHYPGKIDPLDYPEGAVVGSDDFGREYEVIDVEHTDKGSTVHLMYATVESKRRHYEAQGRPVPESQEHERFLRPFRI